ncbi:pentapeptide MXKDX repeat protein [Bradyrhizobium sp. NFR13]|jgi:pentapeptide MXKDX repeat protein|uniref:pentapeptide MXKDX repeat protein n=1 Tax=Bradyrhizobium sp. NFR13 TaxID=1566285 RepID=UPI0008E3DB5F|nr:pentapeptide MXKDX repeat protein [Bradyrhizobium sp. NFR13]SFM06787.1 pentapeptide MXKDX repeat protein [Bradyrhizobium sp. NFR13]
MRKTILAAICVTAIGATPFAAFAQATGPSGQDSTKTGTMAKEGESKATGTQGMSKDSTKKDAMHKNGMKKDHMMKDEMKK